MTVGRRVIVSKNLGEFFHTEVNQARTDLGVELSELTEFYLVQLLCDFSRRETAPTTPGAEPLALMYKKAVEANFEQRVQLLKNLGDVALYMSGFFTDAIERSLVDLDYYISMGGGAYNHLSGLVGSQRHGETLGELYLQLGNKFTELVDVLNQISDRAREQQGEGDKDLLKLYDRWARTGSQRLRKLLLDKGLTPTDGLPLDYLQ